MQSFAGLSGEKNAFGNAPEIDYQRPAPERGVDMLLNKYYHRPYRTEIEMPDVYHASDVLLGKPLREACIFFLTDGGLVPGGNPDRVAPFCGEKFYVYGLGSGDTLNAAEYEISHQGYDHTAVLGNPNRLVPVDAARNLIRRGVLGDLYPGFISVAGVMTPTRKSVQLGREIADYISACPVDAVVITSTCGTSTRCGTYIGLEIIRRGIPVVQIANLLDVAESYGLRKVLKGHSVDCPLGNPELPEQEELGLRTQMLEDALGMLTKESIRKRRTSDGQGSD